MNVTSAASEASQLIPGVSVSRPARAASEVRRSGTKTRSPAAVLSAMPSGMPSSGFTPGRLRAPRHSRQDPEYSRLARVKATDRAVARFEARASPAQSAFGGRFGRGREPPPRTLEFLGEALDLPAQVIPLGHERTDHLRRAAGAELLDLAAQDVPIPRGLAEDRVQAVLALLEAGEEMSIKLIDAAATRGGPGECPLHLTPPSDQYDGFSSTTRKKHLPYRAPEASKHEGLRAAEVSARPES